MLSCNSKTMNECNKRNRLQLFYIMFTSHIMLNAERLRLNAGFRIFFLSNKFDQLEMRDLANNAQR